ncbi:Amidohydrolase [Neorhodopirellula pilleata]|uniref:Amidohydrolase n=2 Tax=Neorhodopirellula pilleata TaxID=2714738 RepID=A0A5C5ZGY2_9BACT|nr:Amidohydrolase [Neorhodopirellula pilleata]
MLMNIRWSLILFFLVWSSPSAWPQSGNESTEGQTARESENDEEATLDGCDGRDLSVRTFDPVSQLKVESTDLQHAQMPVVDVHTHFFYRTRHNRDALDDFVEVMNRNNIAVCASLDGKLGSQLDEHIEYLWDRYRDRFVIYTNVDWRGDGANDEPATWACHRPGFAERTAEAIRNAVKRGVSGLKIFKQFGLGYRNPDGSLIEIDDRRWDPIWAVCGEVGIPVIIHTADPAAFFEPIDARNERWEELSRHPDWSFYGDEYPSRLELLNARNRVIARHPKTTFIGAHIANNPEDLGTVSEWLDRYPNLVIEPASRISELGRQPFTARKFLIRYADRIMFGTDGPQPESRLRLYWRFFETDDEYFPYSEKSPPPQGLWNIYGVDLPDDVLRKIYFENAARIIPGVRERLSNLSKLVPKPPPT